MESDATGSFNVVYGRILMVFEFGSRKREEYGTENGGGTGLLYGQTRGGRTRLDVTNHHPACPRAPVSSHLTLCTSCTPSTPVSLWIPPSGLGIDGGRFFVAWFELNSRASCTVPVDVTVAARPESSASLASIRSGQVQPLSLSGAFWATHYPLITAQCLP